MAGVRVELTDVLYALEIAALFEKDLHKAKQIALGLIEFAIQESDDCPAQKLLGAAGEGYTKRGDQ